MTRCINTAQLLTIFLSNHIAMFSQLININPAPFPQCSQPKTPSYSPSLSIWLRGGADHADSPTIDHDLVHHWTHSQQYFCDDCGALVTTSGAITYHGTFTESFTQFHHDSTSPHLSTHLSSSSSSNCLGRSKGGGGLRRGHAIRRHERPSSVRTKYVDCVKIQPEERVVQPSTRGSKTFKWVWALLEGSKEIACHTH